MAEQVTIDGIEWSDPDERMREQASARARARMHDGRDPVVSFLHARCGSLLPGPQGPCPKCGEL